MYVNGKFTGSVTVYLRARSQDSVCCFAGAYGSLGEAKHVGALGVIGAAAALVGRELAVWVDLELEALEELLAGGAGAGGPVVGAAP